jgi:hypothetical protein
MAKHRNPRPKVSKRPTPDNPDVETGILIRLLYDDLEATRAGESVPTSDRREIA